MVAPITPHKIMRRVAGYHDIRMDGMTDLLLRARGASVLDVGCNRGMVGVEFAGNGATVVHGCDSYVEGIAAAREIFADMRSVESRFEVVDLTQGPSCLNPFGNRSYDIVMVIAVVHKLARVMSESHLSDLVRHLGIRAHRFLGWRPTSDDIEANRAELDRMERDLVAVGMRRVQYSEISDIGPAAIWRRN